MLPEFLQMHPSLSVVAEYSEGYADLIADGFDAAIRVGTLSDSGLIGQKLSDHHRILSASPSRSWRGPLR
jgi:DNA-binding transcriptional LysR family regulator